MKDIIITLDRIKQNLEHVPELKRRIDDLLLELRFERLRQPLQIPQPVRAEDQLD
jgi:hypothetical protein